MIRWLQLAWYSRLRMIDMRILWPACRKGTTCTNQAKAAFAYHALHDPAWLVLGEERIREFIDALE